MCESPLWVGGRDRGGGESGLGESEGLDYPARSRVQKNSQEQRFKPGLQVSIKVHFFKIRG